ncbi:MAG TPA: tol-pal system protein YbgF [Thermohalobaculum sp.]|nr:tol-pal system protein YbgF [Thermohalobaculum sp.]
MRSHFRGMTPRSMPIGAVLLAVLVSLVASLILGATPAAAQSADEMRARLGGIERELGHIRARLGMPPVGPGGGSGVGSGGGTGELIVRLDRLEAQIRELTGKVERLEFEQRRIAEDAARLFGDIEFRLTELEGGDTSSLAPVPPLGGLDETAVAEAVSISERGDLDRAVEDVRQGRYDQAEDRLRSFLSSYPDSPLEAEALYWLGESQFVRGAYQSAARSYLEGYKSDRAGAEAPRNLYRLGVTLGRLGQVNEACLTLAEVRSQFPRGPREVLEGVEDEADALGCG